jgi:hypothetical protein
VLDLSTLLRLLLFYHHCAYYVIDRTLCHSAIGRAAASESGAHVLGLRDAVDLTSSIISNRISEVNGSFTPSPWDGGKMNILIPMAGAGSRFTQAGYTFPKPLIEIAKKPMIQVVVENININANYIFISYARITLALHQFLASSSL